MRKGFIASVLVVSFFVSMNTPAASACKGLSESLCSENAQCRWVGPYVRKDKREVEGYCRTKSSKKLPLVTMEQEEGKK